MKKYALRKKELRELYSDLSALGYEREPKQIFVLEDKQKFIEIEGEIEFFYYEDALVPTIKVLNKYDLNLPEVIVDMGAVKFISKGADVMRPGIVHIAQGIKAEDFVALKDEQNRITICVARAKLSSEDMQNSSKGKVLKNIHYVGDSIWNKVA